MSLSDSESSSSCSSTTEGLPIRELMKLIRQSFRECKKKAKIEKWELEVKLQWSEKKCEELNKTNKRLVEETTAKDMLILDLKQKNNELKNKNIENERFVRVYQERFKRLDTTLVKMKKEIDDLRPEKILVAYNHEMEEIAPKLIAMHIPASSNPSEVFNVRPYVPIISRCTTNDFANNLEYYEDNDEDLEDHYFNHDEDVYDDDFYSKGVSNWRERRQFGSRSPKYGSTPRSRRRRKNHYFNDEDVCDDHFYHNSFSKV